MRWMEAINVGGSIASISGVSLLWLRTLAPGAQLHNLVAGSIASLAGTLLPIGVFVITLELLTAGARWLIASATPRQRTIYWSLASAIAIVASSLLLLAVWTGVYIAWVAT